MPFHGSFRVSGWRKSIGKGKKIVIIGCGAQGLKPRVKYA